MFGIGSTELAIILVFGFLLFGPDKLPQMGRTIGRALRQFRETQEKLTSVVQSEVVDPMTAAVNEPTRPRRVDEDDDDADADASAEEAEVPARKETFAERRARLAAEKAAAEQTAQEGDAAEKDAAAVDSAATASEPAPVSVAVDATDTAAADTEAESEERATADLYARRPRKRKAEAEQVDIQDAEASAQPDDAAEGGDRYCPSDPRACRFSTTWESFVAVSPS